MPFIPHTPDEKRQMLDIIGTKNTEALFDEIPSALKLKTFNLDAGLSEQTMLRRMQARANQDTYELSFLGAGAYEHHIPAVVWDLASRGELMTAYTPYQAEASQGTLQTIYEYQSMVCQLTGMEVSNASVYDGASALAEGILMAIRANRSSQSRRVLCLGALHPHYLEAVRTLVELQGIVVEHCPPDPATGKVNPPKRKQDYAAWVVQQPNFFGILEEVDDITELAHEWGAFMIALVNPTATALLKPPGEWGKRGADIVVGEGQPLGIPLAGGGPYLGFMCTRKSLVRQLPGRIVGQTLDLEGKPGFTLTLQTREQHIRRARATSNICTNQGLLMVAATLYMSLLGPEGLRRVALRCHQRMRMLNDRLCAIAGVTAPFDSAFFHERVINLPTSPEPVVRQLAQEGILAGLPLQNYYPSLPNALLLCATETKESEDIERFAQKLAALC